MYQRYLYILLSGFFLAICITIVIYSRELGIYRGWLGDIIVMMLLFSLVQSIHIFERWHVVVGTLIFAYTIEGLQYINIIDIMSWRGNRLIEVVLGSTFDPLDLMLYTIGGILIGCIDIYWSKNILQKSLSD